MFGVPECSTQVNPSPWCVPARLFVAGNTCSLPFLSSSLSLSLFPLSLPLSLSLSFSFSFSLFSLSCFPLPSYLGVPGCFRHSWEPFSSSPGVSLDACAVAGNTFFSFPFFFFFPLLSPYPSLPRARCFHTQKRRCNRFSMRSGFIGSCLLLLVPFSSFPRYIHVFFLSCPPVFMSWHFTLSFFCAHIGPALSVYAHIFTHF